MGRDWPLKPTTREPPWGKACGLRRVQDSKIELQSELDDPGIATCGDDTAEVAGIKDPTRCGINAAARGEQGAEVADRIREVRMV